MQMPGIDDKMRYVQPIILDNVSVKLGPWSGYNVLAQHPQSFDPGWAAFYFDGLKPAF